MESPSYIAGVLFTFHPQWASLIYFKLNFLGEKTILIGNLFVLFNLENETIFNCFLKNLVSMT